MNGQDKHLYRGIEITPVPAEHICYRCCGDRWEFWNAQIGLMYMHPTIEDCKKDIDRLALCGLIECLPPESGEKTA